tara:strand:- start:188 stop:514 length:327 start_codon:yes stop_codon:yes gene_type:complete
MNVYPTELERLESGQLGITWSDGQRRVYGLDELRKQCPCATCRDERKAAVDSSPALLPVMDLAAAQPLQLDAMVPIGNYAYGLTFSDGHDTGIFTFELLRQLGTEETS